MSKSIEHNIFPDLSPRAEIFEKVGLVEKNWLDDAPMGFPENISRLVQDLHFFRLKGMPARFDEQADVLKGIGLLFNLFSAMYNQGLPIFYMVQWKEGQIALYLGTGPSGESALFALLEASFGPSLVEHDTVIKRFDPVRKPCCVALTGIPDLSESRPPVKQDLPEELAGIDPLITGLMKDEWVYMVQAFPVQRSQANLWLETCAREIKDIKESFLLRDMQKANRMAVHYVDALEKSMRRLKLGKQQGLWQTGVYLLADEAETASCGGALLSSIFSGDKSLPEPIRTHLCSHSGPVSPFINCYHSKELKRVIPFPKREFPGFRLRERAFFDIDFEERGENPVCIGRVIADDQISDQMASVPLADLTKHALVAGVTGSGKTNTIFNLLRELHHDHHIPFLVVEPAKSEYRDLLYDIELLLIFTLGEERPGASAPFRFNPFAFPEGVSLHTHIDSLKAVFNAAFVMYAPMPYVLEECIHRVYEDKGWNLLTSTNPRGRDEISFPTLKDLHDKIDEMVERIGYQDRTTMDIKAALKTRIRNLSIGGKGMMLNSRKGMPFKEIMARPTVLELKYLGNDEEKAFMMGLILMAIWEHYESAEGQESGAVQGLKHLTVIEEAHRLLKNVPTEKVTEEMSNIKGKGIETFCNLLAEMRAYGEGVLVSEQIPAKLASDVIKNSAMKIMHRMVAREDRTVMGDTMNLDRHQQRQVISLDAGRAAFFREGFDRPLNVKVPLSEAKKRNVRVLNTRLHDHMQDLFFGDNRHLLTLFQACHTCPHKDTEQCEITRREVEEFMAAQDWEKITVRCFLPFVLNPDFDETQDHLKGIISLGKNSFHCVSAHLIDHYAGSRGDYYSRPFEEIENIRISAHDLITTSGFGAFLGRKWSELQSSEGVCSSICHSFCMNKCLFGYEISVLVRDPIIHNRMTHLLNRPEYGPLFFKGLADLILDFLGEYLPIQLERHLHDVTVCFLIRKMHENRLPLRLQEEILGELSKVFD